MSVNNTVGTFINSALEVYACQTNVANVRSQKRAEI